MNKPKIFVVTPTPKGINQILSVQPDVAAKYYCAVVNVSDSECATFDYQKAGVPSFWFPINEIGKWGHSPFFGTLRVVNEYYHGDKPILIHCHAGANRSPSVAYAILLAKGYTPQEAKESLNYEDLSEVFDRNIERKHIPDNIIEFLKMANEHPEYSLEFVLRKIDAWYNEWSQKKYDEQNDYTLNIDEEKKARLIYNKDKKRFVIEPWVEPVYVRKEWNVTPIVPEQKK